MLFMGLRFGLSIETGNVSVPFGPATKDQSAPDGNERLCIAGGLGPSIDEPKCVL